MKNNMPSDTSKRLFLFVRADGFYPLELPEEAVADNAKCNPGTLRVEDAKTGAVVWPNTNHEPRR